MLFSSSCNLDVFASLPGAPGGSGTELGELVRLWSAADSLGLVAGRLQCVVRETGPLDQKIALPPEWQIRHTTAEIQACSEAIDQAARERRPLMILLGAVVPTADAVGVLLGTFRSDPYYGFAVPRIASPDGESVLRLSSAETGKRRDLPRAALAETPEEYLTTEYLGASFVISPLLIANLGALDEGFDSLAGALSHYLTRARRRGFRTVIVNRAVVRQMKGTVRGNLAAQPMRLTDADRSRLLQEFEEVERVEVEYGWARFDERESVLASAFGISRGEKPSLLIDARNLQPAHNGTATVILKLANCLGEVTSDWHITVVAPEDSIAYHRLRERCPSCEVITPSPERRFLVALRLSQPWAMSELIELHEWALFNFFLMLDTIAWDVAYCAPPGLNGVWEFIAQHADGLFFISEFSRERFLRRFPSGRSLPSAVCHLSFDPTDYVGAPRPQRESGDSHILVFGNHLDHKDVSPTVDLLSTMFPFCRIVAFGGRSSSNSRVRTVESGQISQEEVELLIAGAKLVVFPSYYEGFGMPIIAALAYGGTVVARNSELLAEMAAQYKGPGRLVGYDSPLELLEIVGRIEGGLEVPGIELGTAAPADGLRTWREVALDLLGQAGELSRRPGESRWIQRESVVRQILAPR